MPPLAARNVLHVVFAANAASRIKCGLIKCFFSILLKTSITYQVYVYNKDIMK